ncbi:uncharacterized protein A4U43_C01F29170 [Asparagus officinalis]|uniref:Uncharacterized protein n=1 Tax=Asparagus officinalis TaxID=4686 RepID=A0A5P1FT08_ASPOF|nr:uncharacterized protein A4U43_C01F29170 [Asparagus officinalis]
MNTTPSSFSSSLLYSKLPINPTRYHTGSKRLYRRKTPLRVRSVSKPDGYEYGHDYGRSSVDENMIVLRKRIEEMRAVESMDPDPPEEWTEWGEEDCYESCYGSDVCQAVGLVQMLAMSVRPGVALGLVGLMLLSVPTSVILFGFHLGQALKVLVS